MAEEKKSQEPVTYTLPSFDLNWFFFLFGVGILHSIEKATQLVQGTPRLAASHRTYQSTFSPTISSKGYPDPRRSREGECELTFLAWQV